MADIVLTGDTSGAITVAAPAVAGTNTLTLPANTGTLMTSTYTGGDVDIDSGTLHVDATNNRVGIGTGSPTTKLSISGTGSQRIDIANTSLTDAGEIVSFQWDDNADFTIQGRDSTGGFKANWYRITSTATDGLADEHIWYTGSSTERMRIDSSGLVGIGNTSPSSYGMMIIDNAGQTTQTLLALKDSGGTGTHSQIQFYNTNGVVGSITTAGSSTSYNTSSDYRLKENVAPMSGSIDRLKQLNPSTWAWIQDGSHGEGFLAHEAQTVVPECAIGTKDAMKTEEYEVTPAVLDDEDNVVTEAVMGTREVPDYQGIDQSKLVPLLTSALQEAVTKIEDLETRIQALENA
tara:strand:+ start:525 stop:1568 length:1044 start_codon:yes stop_codon:yes gene_type:complete